MGFCIHALVKSVFALSAWAVGAVSRVQLCVIPTKAEQEVLGAGCALCDHSVENRAGLSESLLITKATALCLLSKIYVHL